MTKTKTETLAAVNARQVIWVDWMQKATAGLSDDSLVEVTTQHTPFGDYCLGMKPANEQGALDKWLATSPCLRFGTYTNPDKKRAAKHKEQLEARGATGLMLAY
jgi:hypothetical protein